MKVHLLTLVLQALIDSTVSYDHAPIQDDRMEKLESNNEASTEAPRKKFSARSSAIIRSAKENKTDDFNYYYEQPTYHMEVNHSLTLAHRKNSSRLIGDEVSQDENSAKTRSERLLNDGTLIYGHNYTKEQTMRKTETQHLSEQPVSFYVMGDAPYRSRYIGKVREDLERLSLDMDRNDGTQMGQFLVHVGDTNTPSRHFCGKQWFDKVHRALRSSPVPVFVVPGDNDVLDCPMSMRDNFWQYYVKKNPQQEGDTVYFEDNWHYRDEFTVNRQLNRKENWSFVIDSCLFIGLHVHVNYEDISAHDLLIYHNRNWVLSRLRSFHGHTAVIFGHQRPGRSMLKDFFYEINQEMSNRGIDFLYIHGNGHKFFTDEGHIGNMVRLQVDKGSIAPPLKVTINPKKMFRGVKSSRRFEFDRRM